MQKLEILAVGNVNLANDLWGVKMAESLKDCYRVVYCGSTPENFISKVAGADVVVLMDSYNGEDFVLTDKVSECASISTHTYNLNIFADYLRQKDKEFYFLGVGKNASRDKIKAILDHLASHPASDHKDDLEGHHKDDLEGHHNNAHSHSHADHTH